ncbi:MAG: hypothetical protein CLLPBCKN_001299 [Chroococcidiopsis cubana SAG 39.79]|nr:hypothetical protein [Chroococcidiopsis cubana SAG 39.79]
MENQRDIPISTSRDRGFTDYFKKILTKYSTHAVVRVPWQGLYGRVLPDSYSCQENLLSKPAPTNICDWMLRTKDR